MMTMREAKQRALASLDKGDLTSALASMLSDLEKGDDEMSLKKRGEFGTALGMMGFQAAARGDAEELRRWIEGFAE